MTSISQRMTVILAVCYLGSEVISFLLTLHFSTLHLKLGSCLAQLIRCKISLYFPTSNLFPRKLALASGGDDSTFLQFSIICTTESACDFDVATTRFQASLRCFPILVQHVSVSKSTTELEIIFTNV